MELSPNRILMTDKSPRLNTSALTNQLDNSRVTDADWLRNPKRNVLEGVQSNEQTVEDEFGLK